MENCHSFLCFVLGAGMMMFSCSFRFTSGAVRCSIEMMEECMDGVPKFITHSGVHGVVKVDSQDQLDRLCGLYDSSKACVSGFLSACSSKERVLWDRVSNGYQWMCHEGKDEFLSMNPCILANVPAIKYKTDDCDAVYQTAVSSYDTTATCSASAELLTCISNEVLRRCGPKTAHLYRGLLSRMIAPEEKLIHCNLDTGQISNGRTSKVYSAVAGSIIGLMLVIAICFASYIAVQYNRSNSRTKSVFSSPKSRGYKNMASSESCSETVLSNNAKSP